MNQNDLLAERFEQDRAHLRAVAYRMLGSADEADDAAQETWLRLSRSGAEGVESLSGWLTTVVARVCLDALRSGKSRGEQPLGASSDPMGNPAGPLDPEQEVLMADSVGAALLIVLDTLSPAERLAFVLHDMFAVPLRRDRTDRGALSGRGTPAREPRTSPGTGAAQAREADPARQREVVAAFLAASREGDFDALLAVLDPDVVLRADTPAVQAGADSEVRGAPWIDVRLSGGDRMLEQDYLVRPGATVTLLRLPMPQCGWRDPDRCGYAGLGLPEGRPRS